MVSSNPETDSPVLRPKRNPIYATPSALGSDSTHYHHTGQADSVSRFDRKHADANAAAAVGGFAIARQANNAGSSTSTNSYTSKVGPQIPYPQTSTTNSTRLPQHIPSPLKQQQTSTFTSSTKQSIKAHELERAAVQQAQEAMAQTAKTAGRESNNLVPGSEFTKDQSFIIFDWDDTLLPSFWIAQNGLRLDEDFRISPDQIEHLTQTTKLAQELLVNASKHGQVCIITNAETGWVELSCKKYLPGLARELFSGRYYIRSARSEYERTGDPNSTPFGWKCKAFMNETQIFFDKKGPMRSGEKRNVVSFGDSAHEREALLHCSKMLGADYVCKTIKFMERPSVTTLQTQQKMMLGSLDRIIQMPAPLDLQIKAPPPQTN